MAVGRFRDAPNLESHHVVVATQIAMRAGCELAVAFLGSLCCAFALFFAVEICEPLQAACALAMTTYCLAEFILRSPVGPDPS